MKLSRTITLGNKFSFKIDIIAYIIFGIIFGNIAFASPIAALFLILAAAVFLYFSGSPLKALAVFIFLIPFSGTQYFIEKVIALPGAKPLQLIALFVVTIAVLNHRKSEKLPRYLFFFIIAVLVSFTVAIIRSLPNLEMFNSFRMEEVSETRYLLSHYVKPLIYFIPFILIPKFVRKLSEFEQISKVVVWSMIGLSAMVVYFYLNAPSRDDLIALSQFYSTNTGMNRNNIANFYIVVFPLFLMRFFLKKDLANMAIIALTLITVAILMSRTAYFMIVISCILYLLISKRTKFLPVLLAVGLGVVLVMSPKIKERATKGFESGNIDAISAGRTHRIWVPLLEEYLNDPGKLLFGNGRYSTLFSDAAKNQFILEVTHPHNMYLEQVMDAGLIGLAPFLIFFAIVMKSLFQSLRSVEDKKLKEYHYAIIVSILSYLIAGMSGRFLFPTQANSFFWIIAAMAIVLVKISKFQGDNGKIET